MTVVNRPSAKTAEFVDPAFKVKKRNLFLYRVKIDWTTISGVPAPGVMRARKSVALCFFRYAQVCR